MCPIWPRYFTTLVRSLADASILTSQLYHKSLSGNNFGLPYEVLLRIDLQPFIDKVATRMDPWKHKLINRAGCAELGLLRDGQRREMQSQLTKCL